MFGQRLHVGHHEVGVGLVVATAHPAAQLVQLGQAKLVGARHHYGVGRGYVDTGFNNGRAQQQVVTLGDKVFHHFF